MNEKNNFIIGQHSLLKNAFSCYDTLRPVAIWGWGKLSPLKWKIARLYEQVRNSILKHHQPRPA